MLHFLGIGAQKCGTTWLFARLQTHPMVNFPAGKEVHFWDQHRDRGVDWWLSLFAECRPSVKCGEVTPAYATLDRAAVAEISRVAPGLRIFYSIRNPIARAWSSALMAMQRAEMDFPETSDQWFRDHFNSAGSRARGGYLRSIETWLSVFDPESLHVIFFDDIVAKPEVVLTRLAKHIGVDPGPFLDVSRHELATPVFRGPRFNIRPRLLESLRQLYAEDIAQLSSHFGRDLTHWLHWEGKK